jgi:hypothetical protein
MGKPMQQFQGFGLTAATDRSYFGCLLQPPPVTRPLMESILYILVGDAKAMAYLNRIFLEHSLSARFNKVIVNGRP